MQLQVSQSCSLPRKMKRLIKWDSKTNRAIESGLAFLAVAQTTAGEIPIYTCDRRDMVGELHPDPCVFPTALAAYALGFVPGAELLLERAIHFLVEQRSPSGVWHHWRNDHAHFTMLPPDVDDTSCVSLVLNRHGVSGAADRRILLENRNREGLFYTWLLPRLRWTSAPHRLVMLEQLRLIMTQGPFFRNMSAAADDVDAVVNANCLSALGPFKGDALVINYLLRVLRAGKEASCDKWYDSAFAVWYFFSRVLPGRAPEAAELIVQRMASVAPKDALELAHGISSMISCKQRPADTWITSLLDSQLANGAWPSATIYIGGRVRGPDGWFGNPPPGTPYWGSEAMTTAFCLQALAQWRDCSATSFRPNDS